MKALILILTAFGVTACTPSPYIEHYNKNGTLHPELMAKHRTECIALGFKDNSTALAECRKDLAQDWKNNLEAGRRDRALRPYLGVGYGYGRRGSGIGVGGHW